MSVRVSSRLPVFSSAQGKVFLAFSPCARCVHRSKPDLKHLESELRRIRERGVAAHSGVISEDWGSRAAPVFQGDDVAGTLSLVGDGGRDPRRRGLGSGRQTERNRRRAFRCAGA
jgi:DNA-binding IclR family transcriptional regulator